MEQYNINHSLTDWHKIDYLAIHEGNQFSGTSHYITKILHYFEGNLVMALKCNGIQIKIVLLNISMLFTLS